MVVYLLEGWMSVSKLEQGGQGELEYNPKWRAETAVSIPRSDRCAKEIKACKIRRHTNWGNIVIINILILRIEPRTSHDVTAIAES